MLVSKPDDETPPAPDAPGGRRWPFWPAVATLLVALVVTAVLVLVSSGLYRGNEKRLVDLRARDVASALTSALPSVQVPLASASALADATRGDVAKFKRFVAPYVGGAGRPFVSASLWLVRHPQRGPVAVVGSRPVLESAMSQAPAFFARASAASNLTVLGLLQPPRLRLGFAFTGVRSGPYTAYGESALPSDRYMPVQKGSAFADVDYALYLGSSTKPAGLLLASVRRLPLRGRRATVTVPFGDTRFTVMVAPRGPLGGSLPQRLPWAIAIAGTLLGLGAAALTLRLIEGRRHAEQLASRLEQIAAENQRLYAEQRGIAQTLQRALLPEALPELPGLQTSARYEPGVRGVDVGGDWYDVIAIDDQRLLLVVGDVSGRGLRAAATMASLRYAIHAYAAQGDPPPVFLSKLSNLVSVRSSKELATVLCALVDVPRRQLSVTSAGHLPPLLISSDSSEFVQSEVGLPIGVNPTTIYSATTISAPAGATLLAFTDGLVERRGESIDLGLERLRAYATSNRATLDELLTRVLSNLRHDGAQDDTAIAGIRWVS